MAKKKPKEQPARRGRFAVPLLVVVVVALVGWRVVAAREERAREQARERAERKVEERRAMLPSLRKVVQARRAEAIDAQCKGRGSLPNGWIYDGAQHEQNAWVARERGCLPLSEPNITNFFCCASADPRDHAVPAE